MLSFILFAAEWQKNPWRRSIEGRKKGNRRTITEGSPTEEAKKRRPHWWDMGQACHTTALKDKTVIGGKCPLSFSATMLSRTAICVAVHFFCGTIFFAFLRYYNTSVYRKLMECGRLTEGNGFEHHWNKIRCSEKHFRLFHTILLKADVWWKKEEVRCMTPERVMSTAK